MLKYIWKQLVWPKFLRPLLRERGLQLPAIVAARIAAELETIRDGRPISAADVRVVWGVEVTDLVVDALDVILDTPELIVLEPR